MTAYHESHLEFWHNIDSYCIFHQGGHLMTSITHELDLAETPTKTSRLPGLKLASGVSVLGIIVGLWFGLGYAGTDTMQGDVQRLFYLHLPVFFAGTLAFIGSMLSALLYLVRRRVHWDRLSVALVEVGLMFTVVTIVTGSIWARPTWNTWWTASPRLVATLITALIYLAYLLMRDGFRRPKQQRWFSAGYLLTALVLAVYMIMMARLREDGIHPTVIGASAQNSNNGMSMSPNMATALVVNIAVWAGLVLPVLVVWRLRLEGYLQARKHR
jgi:heme exporter protein C